ncbi:hypothetical protein BK120_15840 [Paenibacillus sp. FSL A5-0031]|uniref:glycosyltransferase family 4 protein n=1 Tax=Paenibacillus sp. FSL A5-0031 TaxID=1920420 RepID=UPI00096FFFB1|nr:glycosyltransferase family 4 protein [Paenibacillus sp. FSL A5-0031]OME82141.1 hypothetical protein BK120_15840 [Paenibacillus sp. FSL A5-0031]
MKDILLVTNYCQFPGESGNSRYTYLAEKLVEAGFKVEIIASTFYHKTKKQRTFDGDSIKGVGYKATLIYEPGYSKNVSLKRIHSNKVIAGNIIKYLKKRKKPDLIYCPFPPISIGNKVAKFSANNKIPFVIDIQDLWPEAFKMVFKLPLISDLLFKPMEMSANKVFKNANAVVAVSETYVNRALSVNKSLECGLSVFLGTDLVRFDSYSKQQKGLFKPKNEIWIVYIGTLGNSYDINTVSEALKILKERDIYNIKFIVIGDGPKRTFFEKYANELDISYEFTGMMLYEDMVRKLILCDIGVNPIIKGTASSIINKVGDYAAAGIPVVNTQESLEYRNYIESLKIGLNCECENSLDVANKLEELINNKDLRKEMGLNNRLFAESKFDRSKTYAEIVNLIKSLVDDN